MAGWTPSTTSQCGSTPTSSGARGGFLPTICREKAQHFRKGLTVNSCARHGAPFC